MTIEIRRASYNEAKQIKDVANQHRYTKHFSHPAYCNRPKFERGEIIVACEGDEIVGFAALRIKKRLPETVVDIIGVSYVYRRSGIGKQLLDYVCENDNNKYVVLDVMNDNPKAISFYDKYGFKYVQGVMNGKAIRMMYTKQNVKGFL